MAGIYIHIPFCKQACSYCDFYFLTNPSKKSEFVEALHTEIHLQKDFFEGEKVETIYLGGGTPSSLSDHTLESILQKVFSTFKVKSDAEITLEVNPDDISEQRLSNWWQMGFNRLSIGVQSFSEDQLKWMNRAHSSDEAKGSLEVVYQSNFQNFSLDLIFGLPKINQESIQETLQQFLQFSPPHFSCYALAVEDNTKLSYLVSKKRICPVKDAQVSVQFLAIHQELVKHNYIHYEVSNYSKKGFHSRHNNAYWKGKPYLGLGPGAHGFKSGVRYVNIPNLRKYIESLSDHKLYQEQEKLSVQHQFNEFIMTRLRTIEGFTFKEIELQFGNQFLVHLKKNLPRHYQNNEQALRLSIEDWLFADSIASDLFYISA